MPPQHDARTKTKAALASVTRSTYDIRDTRYIVSGTKALTDKVPQETEAHAPRVHQEHDTLLLEVLLLQNLNNIKQQQQQRWYKQQ